MGKGRLNANGKSMGYCDKLMAYCILQKWQNDPMMTKYEIGLNSAWKRDVPENHVPLSEAEVTAMIDFVGPHALRRDLDSSSDDWLA